MLIISSIYGLPTPAGLSLWLLMSKVLFDGILKWSPAPPVGGAVKSSPILPDSSNYASSCRQIGSGWYNDGTGLLLCPSARLYVTLIVRWH